MFVLECNGIEYQDFNQLLSLERFKFMTLTLKFQKQHFSLIFLKHANGMANSVHLDNSVA